MDVYKVKLELPPAYIYITAPNESVACDKASNEIGRMSAEEIGELLIGSEVEISEVELHEEGPDTSDER